MFNWLKSLWQKLVSAITDRKNNSDQPSKSKGEATEEVIKNDNRKNLPAEKPQKKSAQNAVVGQRKIKDALKFNLTNKIVYLVDYENTGCLPTLSKKNSKEEIVYAFIGKTQQKNIYQEIKSKDLHNVLVVKCDTVSKNYNDIVIGTYIGGIFSLYNPKEVVLYSMDKGFTAIVDACRQIGIENVRMFQNQKNEITNRELSMIWKDLKILYGVNRSKSNQVIEQSDVKKKIKRYHLSNSNGRTSAEFADECISKMVALKMMERVDYGKDLKFLKINYEMPRDRYKKPHQPISYGAQTKTNQQNAFAKQ